MIVKTTNVAIDGNLLILTIPSITLVADAEYTLRICQDIPEGAGVNRVKIKHNGTDYNFLVRTGNYVRADQLKTRKEYPTVFGNSPDHFSMLYLYPVSCYQATQA